MPGIEGRLRAAWEAGVEADLREPWKLQLPEWDMAPGEMNMKVMLWLRGLAKAFDMHGYGEMRYNLLGNGGHWFPGKNAAEAGAADLEPAGKMSGLGAERLRSLLRESHEMLGKKEVKRLSQS